MEILKKGCPVRRADEVGFCELSEAIEICVIVMNKMLEVRMYPVKTGRVVVDRNRIGGDLVHDRREMLAIEENMIIDTLSAIDWRDRRPYASKVSSVVRDGMY